MDGTTIILGGGAILISLFSVLYQRRQTQLMEAQLDKAIEVKISRDLAEDTSDGEINSKLRTFLNRRLSEIRVQMRQEMTRLSEDTRRELEGFQRMLGDKNISNYTDILGNAVSMLKQHEGALDSYNESTNKVRALDSQVNALQQALADMRRGIGNEEMIRTQIRGIAEQLLRMTSTDQHSESMDSASRDMQLAPPMNVADEALSDQQITSAQLGNDVYVRDTQTGFGTEGASRLYDAQELYGQPTRTDEALSPLTDVEFPSASLASDDINEVNP